MRHRELEFSVTMDTGGCNEEVTIYTLNRLEFQGELQVIVTPPGVTDFVYPNIQPTPQLASSFL